MTFAPIADGEWHQVTGSGTASAAPSFNLETGFACSSACAGAQVNFDDLVFDQSPPTAVRVTPRRAVRASPGIPLRWRAPRKPAFAE